MRPCLSLHLDRRADLAHLDAMRSPVCRPTNTHFYARTERPIFGGKRNPTETSERHALSTSPKMLLVMCRGDEAVKQVYGNAHGKGIVMM